MGFNLVPSPQNHGELLINAKRFAPNPTILTFNGDAAARSVNEYVFTCLITC